MSSPILGSLPRRIPAWSQLHTSHRVMGGTIFLLMLVVLFMGHERYANFHQDAPPLGMGMMREKRPPSKVLDPLEKRIAWSELHYREFLDERQKFIKDLGGASSIAAAGGSWYVIWDFFLPCFDCQHFVERIGRLGDGGKWICGMNEIAQKEDPVIYSFGVSDDSSFEAALLHRAPRAQVYGYDFSVDSWGPQIENVPGFRARAHFHKWAVGGTDAHGPESDPNFQVYTLDTLMKLNGHTWIDILKIDVEGAEFEVLRAFCKFYMERGLPLPFGQLQVEIHEWDYSFAEFLEWWEMLERAGLRPFRSEPNLVYVNLINEKPMLAEYSFINLGGRHELVQDI